MVPFNNLLARDSKNFQYEAVFYLTFQTECKDICLSVRRVRTENSGNKNGSILCTAETALREPRRT